MSGLCSKRSTAGRQGERGGARLKFLVTVCVLAIIAYAGYQYIPVAINDYQFKDYMQQSVDKAVALGKNSEWVKTQLEASLANFNVPPDATITTVTRDGRLEATVQFTRPIQLPFYTYQYDFDHTVKSTDMMIRK